MSKILIAYFSASGVTARTAKEMAKAAGADLYEICPAEPYTAADLNWMDQKSRSTLEMNDPACRPAIAAPAADLDQYDTVFVGFPIWWYVEPRIVDTFLERSDFFRQVADALAHTLEKRGCMLKLMSMNLYDMEGNSRLEKSGGFQAVLRPGTSDGHPMRLRYPFQ